MNLQTAKIELIEMLIRTEKVGVLNKVRTVLEEENKLTDKEYIEIDARRNRHLNNESKSFSWEQTKQLIKN